MQDLYLKDNLSVLKNNSHIWDEIYKASDSILNFPNEHFVRIFSKHLASLGNKFLDWGIGSGNNAQFMTTQGKNVYGAEVSSYAIDTVKKLYKSQFNKAIKIEQISDNKLNFKDNYFDCIVSWQVQCYNNENTFKLFLEESFRCLKKNGVLVFTLTDINDLIFENSKKIGNNTYISNYQNQKGVILFAVKENAELKKYIHHFTVIDDGFFSYKLNKKLSKHSVFILKK